MAQYNLLDIVPDKLFQTHSIAEIDKVQKKLQYEIERKREDLRAMVGERYRDLIQAADTIEEMKNTTASTLDHIGEMISACRKLHDTHLIGFKIGERSTHHQSYQISNNIHGIGVQMKVLMEIPEKICRCIETEDYVAATQLFILARHINAGIELHIGGKTIKSGMESMHRLLQLQWSSISNFNQMIMDVCQQKLQDVNIDVEVACSCLVSIYLLDSKNMVDLLNTLIGLHSTSSLRSTLHFDLCNALGSDVRGQIRGKIVNSVKVVLKTVELVYSCFVENGGLVSQRLHELYRKESQPLIGLVNFSNKSALKFLPSTILNYRLTPSKDIQVLSKLNITQCVKDWGVQVKCYIDENVKALLENITKVKGLHEIREEAFKIETPSDWPTICASLDMPDVHVWCHYYQPLLTARVKRIIDDRWTHIYTLWNTQILKDLSVVSAANSKEKEVDINWFVWNDLIGETVIESRNDVIKVMNSLMKDMWLQDRGFTLTLEKLCQSMDGELQRTLEDLTVYLYPVRKGSSNKHHLLYSFEDEEDTNEMYCDKAEIQNYLRDVSEEKLHSILQFVKSSFNNSELQQNELQRKTIAIYTARFTQALVHLVPNLRKCFIPDQRNDFNYNADNDAVTHWNKFCADLKEACLFCWNRWVDIVMFKVQDLTTVLPQSFTLEANIDYLMVQWDIIKIEEKDEEGKSIESTIKVPSGPSLKLQEYLYAVSRILNEVVPHTLPPEIHATFVEKVSDITFAHYDNVIRRNETDINQRCALQLLMDVRHLTLLLVPRENKKVMDYSHEICEFLRQKIDPFDYDVFYPYIQTNLKRSVQRVQTILGDLVLHHGQVSVILGGRPVLSGGTADKAPALLAPAAPDAGHWFTLLPVTAPLALHKKAEKTKKKPTTASPGKSARSEISELMSNSLPINLTTARAGAASFFNDWFSGS